MILLLCGLHRRRQDAILGTAARDPQWRIAAQQTTNFVNIYPKYALLVTYGFPAELPNYDTPTEIGKI